MYIPGFWRGVWGCNASVLIPDFTVIMNDFGSYLTTSGRSGWGDAPAHYQKVMWRYVPNYETLEVAQFYSLYRIYGHY